MLERFNETRFRQEVQYIVATLPYKQAVKSLRKKVIYKESQQCSEEAALATERT